MCRDKCLPDCPVKCCSLAVANQFLNSESPSLSLLQPTTIPPKQFSQMGLASKIVCPATCDRLCTSACPVACCSQNLSLRSLTDSVQHVAMETCSSFCARYCLRTCPRHCCKPRVSKYRGFISKGQNFAGSIENRLITKDKINKPKDPLHNFGPALSTRVQVTCPKYCQRACLKSCPLSCCQKVLTQRQNSNLRMRINGKPAFRN